jgi:hypothetical protein
MQNCKECAANRKIGKTYWFKSFAPHTCDHCGGSTPPLTESTEVVYNGLSTQRGIFCHAFRDMSNQHRICPGCGTKLKLIYIICDNSASLDVTEEINSLIAVVAQSGRAGNL